MTTENQQQQAAPSLTKAEVECLIQSALLEFTEVVKTYVEDVSKADTPDKAAEDSDDPLVKRLKVLEQKLADAEKAEQDRQAENSRLRFEAELNKQVASFNPEYLDQVQSILVSRLSDAKETPAGWVVGGGKSVQEAVTEFFATPFGKHLLPPVPTAGIGTKPPQKQQQSQQANDSNAIVSAFL